MRANVRGVIRWAQVATELDEGIRVGCAVHRLQRKHWLRRRHAGSPGQARTVGQHRAVDVFGACSCEQQTDVGAETAADDRGLAEMGECRIGVGKQDLGGVATPDRQGRLAVSREVERHHGARPGVGVWGRDAG